MHLQWDEHKNASNIAKHGVSFAQVAECDWSSALVVADTRYAYQEARFAALVLLHGRVHHVVFTMRQNAMRVISFRKANARERKRYEKE